MGLDMIQLGKPKPGFEKRFDRLYRIIQGKEKQEISFFEKLKGKKIKSKDELLEEWFSIQIQPYETIKAPKVGRDKEADEWIKNEYEKLEDKPPFDEFLTEYNGYYVIELAKEKDGVPVYFSLGEDKNVFRGKFLENCVDLIGEDLVNEAWETKLGADTLDYGNRLMEMATKIATENNLEYLKNQRIPPDTDIASLESKLHIVFSLAKWLIFYGKNGHGYEAYY